MRLARQYLAGLSRRKLMFAMTFTAVSTFAPTLAVFIRGLGFDAGLAPGHPSAGASAAATGALAAFAPAPVPLVCEPLRNADPA